MLKAFTAAQYRLAAIKDRFSSFSKDDGGAALVEYALLVGLMAVLCIGAITGLKDHVGNAYSTIGAKLDTIK